MLKLKSSVRLSNYLCLFAFLSVFTNGCGKKQDDDAPAKIEHLSNYVGRWKGSCEAQFPSKEIEIIVGSTGTHFIHEFQYESAASCGGNNPVVALNRHFSTVKSIAPHETDSSYEVITIDNLNLLHRAMTEVGSTLYNSHSICNKSDWKTGTAVRFDAASPGTCYQAQDSYAAKLNGNSMLRNGRKIFDSPDGPDAEFSRVSPNEPVNGLIKGTPWVYLIGSARSIQAGELMISLKDSYSSDPCWSMDPDSRQALFSMPAAVGSVSLGMSKTATLATGSDNFVATTGSLQITTIDENQVSGNVSIEYDGEYKVAGEFTAKICKQ